MAVPTHTQLFTIDVDSLYTNISTPLGLDKIKSIFSKYPDSTRPDTELLQLLTICLNNNDFSFNNQHFLQVNGTAMGQRYAPSYANLYMSEWEREALAKCDLKPLFYFRFLDDIIGAWPHDVALFPDFINTLNSHHPSIKLKYIIDPHQVHFLDTTVFFQAINPTQNKLLTKVYFKSTDTHALLHKSSYHPKHTFKGIIKSQIIRFHRISSLISDFHNTTSILFSSLRHRGYSKRFLRQIKNSTLAALAPIHSLEAPPQMSEGGGRPPTTAPTRSSKTLALYPNQGLYPNPPCLPSLPYPNQGLHPDPPYPPSFTAVLGGTPPSFSNSRTTHQPQLIPFISTFSHRTSNLHRTLKHNFSRTQTHHPALQNCQVISAHRKNNNLKSILVRSTFKDNSHSPQTQHDSMYKNRKFIHNIHSRASHPTLGTFSLHSSNIIYIITCTSCSKHYIGETKHTLLTRLKQHTYNIGEGRLTTPLVRHFQIHSPTNLIISGLESNNRWTIGQRKRAEKIWIDKLGTMVPLGFNDK